MKDTLLNRTFNVYKSAIDYMKYNNNIIDGCAYIKDGGIHINIIPIKSIDYIKLNYVITK